MLKCHLNNSEEKLGTRYKTYCPNIIPSEQKHSPSIFDYVCLAKCANITAIVRILQQGRLINKSSTVRLHSAKITVKIEAFTTGKGKR